MSLSVRELTKTYGSQVAVDHLSFDISGGQIMGFLGPNGAGKSTTMKMISGFVRPSSGTAEVCGYDIINDPIEVKKHIGYLPEHNPLYLNMYVVEYLRFVAGLHDISNRHQAVTNVIDKVGLGKEQHKKISALSKGYRQRVGIAQAIIHDPKVLILDEPTSGLDMNQLVDIRNLILDLGKENTVILSTHIMQEVEALCDRVIIINDGKLIADEAIGQLQSRIKGEDKIIVELAQKSIDLQSIMSISGVTQATMQDHHITIHTEQAKDIRAAIFHNIVDQGGTILEMTRTKNNVEDIFHKLTKISDNG